MDYLSKLVGRSLTGAGWVMGLLTIIAGAILGAWAAGFIRLTDQDLANLGIWAAIGGTAAFVFYLLVRGPYLLYRDEREARLKAEESQQPYSVTNIGQQINLSFMTPNGRRVEQGSNTLFRAREGEGFLLPAGTVTPDLFWKSESGSYIVGQVKEWPSPEEPQSPDTSKRDPPRQPPSQE